MLEEWFERIALIFMVWAMIFLVVMGTGLMLWGFSLAYVWLTGQLS